MRLNSRHWRAIPTPAADMFEGLPRGACADPNYDPANKLQRSVHDQVIKLWIPTGPVPANIANLATTFAVLAQLKQTYRAFAAGHQAGPLASAVKATADAFDAAFASADVYFWQSIPEMVPEGYVRVNDVKELAKLGIRDKIKLVDDASGAYSAVYAKGAVGAAGSHYIVANRGTDDGFVSFSLDHGFRIAFSLDAWTSIEQNRGAVTGQYLEAVAAAKALSAAADATHGSLVFTGHSLGGGLASAQAMVTGKRAYTFNPSGLNEATIGGSLAGAERRITAYVYPGNWLDGWQGLGVGAPPVGKRVDIDHIKTRLGDAHNNPSDWHLLNFVIPGMFGMLQNGRLTA